MDKKENVIYKDFTIEHFPLKWKIAEKEFETDGYIILSKTKLGEGLYLPLYCEDKEGKSLNFQTLEEAKKWIDEFGNDYHIVVKNRDEIHAVPNEQIEDSLLKGEKKMKKYNIGDSVKFKDGRKGIIFDYDDKFYYAEDNQGCTRKIVKAEDTTCKDDVSSNLELLKKEYEAYKKEKNIGEISDFAEELNYAYDFMEEKHPDIKNPSLDKIAMHLADLQEVETKDNIIPKEVEEIYTKPFEKKMEDEKPEEPKANYTHVVYLYPGFGVDLKPYYVTSDTEDIATIIALAVKQAIENGDEAMYYTEEDLADLTDEEKDEYLYFDLSEFGLPNVYVDGYNTKVYTKEEDPYKPEETKAETEAPVEDSKCKDGEEELYTENLFGEKVNLPKYLEEKGIDFAEEQHNGETVVYPKPKEEDYEGYKYDPKTDKWNEELWYKSALEYEKAQYKLFEEIKKDFPNLKTYDYYTGTITIFGFILPEDEVKIEDSFAEEWNYEGWYVEDIIDELTPEFEMIEEGNANRSKFKTVGDLKSWIKEQYPLNNATKVLGYNSAVSLVLLHFSERVMNEFGGYTAFPIRDSQSQEIGKFYEDFSKKYNVDLDKLVYGEDGFMKSCYPDGFPDFNGDVIYTEKYWNEFEKWLKEVKGIELKEEKQKNFWEDSIDEFFRVEFFNEGNLLEGQTEDFNTYLEAKEYAEDRLAIIAQNGAEVEIPLENLSYEITKLNCADYEDYDDDEE